MDSLVLDTDVVSFFAKSDTGAAAYAPDVLDRQLCICFQTVAELRLWTLIRRWVPPVAKAWKPCWLGLLCGDAGE